MYFEVNGVKYGNPRDYFQVAHVNGYPIEHPLNDALGTDLVSFFDLSHLGANGLPVGVTLDGDQVSSVQDLKKGSTRFYVQANGSLQPTLCPNAIDGQYSLYFGNQQCLQSSSDLTLGEWVIVTILRTTSGNNVIYESSANASAEDGLWAWSGTTGFLSSRAGPVYSYYTPGFTNDSTWRVLEQEFLTPGAHANHKVYYNGVQQTLTNAASSAPGVGSFTKPWNIGARNGAQNFLIGEISAQFILKGLAPTHYKRVILHQYINLKWPRFTL